MAKQLTKAEIEKGLKKLLNLDFNKNASEAVAMSNDGVRAEESKSPVADGSSCRIQSSGKEMRFAGDIESPCMLSSEVLPSQSSQTDQVFDLSKNDPSFNDSCIVYSDLLKNSVIKVPSDQQLVEGDCSWTHSCQLLENGKNSPMLMRKSENLDQIKPAKLSESRSKKKKKKKRQPPKTMMGLAAVDQSIDKDGLPDEVLISDINKRGDAEVVSSDAYAKQELLDNATVGLNMLLLHDVASKLQPESPNLSENSPRKLLQKSRLTKPVVMMSAVTTSKEASNDIQVTGHPHQVELSVPTKFDSVILTSPMKAVKALESYNLSNLDRLTKCRQMEEIMAILKEQHILPLKRKSARHPRANYFCHLCEYHCDNLISCKKHIKGVRHIQLKEDEELNFTLRQLPPPENAQVEVIGQLLTSLAEKFGLSERDVSIRENVVKELHDTLKEHLPDGCTIEMYGSSSSGVGLKECQVDIDLRVPSNASINPAHVLKQAYDTIISSNRFGNVRTDWGAKLPVVYFEHCQSHLKCVLGLNNIGPCLTTQLIKSYVQLDPRVWILCCTLRYWAKVCEVNKQQEGTLPSHAFDLMVIYFLQQCDPPVLPVLHDLVKGNKTENVYLDAREAKKVWATENSHLVGFLWIELFRFYAVAFPNSDLVVCIRDSTPLTASKRNWRGRKLAIEDPFAIRRNLARCVSSQKNYEFILSCFKHTLKYFGIPQTENGALFNKIDKPADWSSGGPPEELLSINCKKTELLENDSPNFNQDAVVETSVLPDVSEKQQFTGRERLNSTLTIDSEDLSNSSNVLTSSDDEDVLELNIQQSEEKPNKKHQVVDSGSPKKEVPKKPESRTDGHSLKKLKNFQLPTPPEILALVKTVKPNDYIYAFFWVCLTGGKRPIIECSICQKEGHLKQNCPDEILPPLQQLPCQHPEFTRFLTDVCRRIVDCFSLRPTDQKMHETILNELTLFIQDTYPDAQLDLFGSSCNGFGFRNSDLDICVTFKSNKTGQELNFSEIITTLGDKLKKCKNIYQVVAIPTAKVPIVKFTHRRSGLECDVSLYNTLAQQNTKMLRLYSQIDPRVRALGYTMKYFAKLCDIGDASRGSLSSYAYTLMVLYFLQQRRPAVIPVLQELYDPNQKDPPKNIVDGWNAWYFSDLRKLDRVWPHKGRNKESIGELWIGLLRFYTEEFDFKQLVVSIRQFKPLTRFEKLWNSRCIAIEDPFDLSHNLGLGVSRKMNIYIMKAFIRGREIFGVPLFRLPPGYDFLDDYLFDPKVLTDGPPPNDRCCRACGRIGHLVRDCPRKKQPLHNESDKKKQNNPDTVKDKGLKKESKIEEPKNSASPSRVHHHHEVGQSQAASIPNQTLPAMGQLSNLSTVQPSLPCSPRRIANQMPAKQQFGDPVGIMPLQNTNKLSQGNITSEQSQDLAKIVDAHINGLLTVAQQLPPSLINHPSKSQMHPPPVSNVLNSSTSLPLFARAPNYTAFVSDGDTQKSSSSPGISHSSCASFSPRGFQNPFQSAVASAARPLIQMPNPAMIRSPWPTALPRPFRYPHLPVASKPFLGQSDAPQNPPSFTAASAVMHKATEQPSSPGRSAGAVTMSSPTLPMVPQMSPTRTFLKVGTGEPVYRIGFPDQKKDGSVIIQGWSPGREGRNEASVDQVELMSHLPR